MSDIKMNKSGISTTLIMLMLISTVIVPTIGIFPKTVKGLDGDEFYPVEIDVKVGSLPGGLYQDFSEGWIGALFDDELEYSYQPGYEEYDSFDAYLTDQLKEITWSDEHGEGNRVFIKLQVKNRMSYDISDINALVEMPDARDPVTLKPLIAYQYDPSLQHAYSGHNYSSNRAYVGWGLPHLYAGESVDTFFIAEDIETDGIVFSAGTNPRSLEMPTPASGLVTAKIISANGLEYTDWDYENVPHLKDTVSVFKPGVSLGMETPLLVNKYFSSSGNEHGSFRYSSFNVGDQVEVTIRVDGSGTILKDDPDTILNGDFLLGFTDIVVRDYMPPFLEFEQLLSESSSPSVELVEINGAYQEMNQFPNSSGQKFASGRNDTVSFYVKGIQPYSYFAPSAYITYTARVIGEGSSPFLPTVAGNYGLTWIYRCKKCYGDEGPPDLPPSVMADTVMSSNLDWFGMTCYGNPSSLGYSPSSLNFGDMFEDDNSIKTLNIGNNGGETLEYDISCEDDWITVDPVTGSSSGETNAHTVTVDTADLSPGEHNSFIYVASNPIPISVNVVEGSTTEFDEIYPVEIGIKVGKFPTELLEKVYPTWAWDGTPVDPPDPCNPNLPMPCRAVSYDDVFLKNQLKNITWHDEGEIGIRNLIKVEIKNHLSTAVTNVKATIQIPPNSYWNGHLEPLIVYQQDSSLQESYYGYNTEDIRSLTWDFPYLAGEETVDTFFIADDIETDGIVFSIGRDSYNSPVGQTGEMIAKITEANSLEYTDWDYECAPYMKDDMNVGVTGSPSPSGVYIDKQFAAFSQDGSNKLSSFTVGDHVSVIIKIQNNAPFNEVFGGPPLYDLPVPNAPCLELRDYLSPFITVDVGSISSPSLTIAKYYEENNSISWLYYGSLSPNATLIFSYSGTVTSSGSLNFVPASVSVFMIRPNPATGRPGVASLVPHYSNFNWVGMTCYGNPPILGHSPPSINFGDVLDGVTVNGTLNVWNMGGGILEYDISCEDDWVSVDPMSGSSSGETNAHTVTVDTTGLSLGEHISTVYIESSTLEIIINVVEETPSEPILHFSPASYNFGDVYQNTTNSCSFKIQNKGSESLEYSLTSEQDWATVTPDSGNSTGELDSILVEIHTTELSFGLHVCNVVISSNVGNSNFTITVNVVKEPVEVEISSPKGGFLYLRGEKRFEIKFLKDIPLIIGDITVEVNINDSQDISYVKFYVDDDLKENISEKPYSWVLDFKIYGLHLISVEAYDNENNLIGSNEIDILIFNRSSGLGGS